MDTSSVSTPPGVPTLADRIGRSLMLMLGISSFLPFAQAASTLSDVAPVQFDVEVWRMFGYLVFAGLYALLALWPRRMPGIWELVFFHKTAVTAFLAVPVFTGAAAALPGDTTVVILIVDSVLIVVTSVSYVLTRGWLSWRATP